MDLLFKVVQAAGIEYCKLSGAEHTAIATFSQDAT
jgi:hypothetical protein